MTVPDNTRCAVPVPRRTPEELRERLLHAVRSEGNALVLCDDAAQAAVVGARLAGELDRMSLPRGWVSGPTLAVDATGRGVYELCRAVYESLAAELKWPPTPEAFDTLFDEFRDVMNGLALIRDCSERLAEMRRPGGRPASGRVVLPTLVVWGVEPQTAWIFASWRDELWGVQAPWVVCAPDADKNRYLLTYSDSFFYAGGVHRLTASA